MFFGAPWLSLMPEYAAWRMVRARKSGTIGQRLAFAEDDRRRAGGAVHLDALAAAWRG